MNGKIVEAALAALASLTLIAGAAATARAQSPPGQSTDEELLRQLRANPLDDVDRQLFAPRQASPAAEEPDGGRDDAKQGAEDLKRKLSRELGPAAVPEDDDPLVSIARNMRRSEDNIAAAQAGAATQRVQKQIVDDLDKLIQQARRNCRKGGSGKSAGQATAQRNPIAQPGKPPGAGQGNPSSKPATDSNAKAGHAEPKPPDMKEVRSLIEKQVWGSLPEAERQQLMQLYRIEEFLPKYEPMIIEYFKRLAEEQGRGKDE